MSVLLYYFGLVQLLLFWLFIFRTKTYYADEKKKMKLPAGGFIIMSNHRSFLDGIVIAIRFFSRRMHFFTVDYYQNSRKPIKLMVILAGGIFLNEDRRNVDYIEKTTRIINKNRPVLIFPEGGFKCGYEPDAFSPGYIMLAVHTGAPIVPVVNDFHYSPFGRTRLLIGKPIDLSGFSEADMTGEKRKEINEKLSREYRMLFYKLKRKKAERFRFKYGFASPKKGDVIRVFNGHFYHYGVYISPDEVIQFGYAVNTPGAEITVNAVTPKEFCGGEIPEVRIFPARYKRFRRTADDTERYARSCLGAGNYSALENNCLDFANRVTLNI